MRYFWIAIGFAVLHRLLVAGIFLLGFGLGMGAFNGSSSASLASPLFALSGLIDFPSTILGYAISFISQRHIPLSDGALGFGAASMSLPLPLRILSSLVIGAFISYFFYRRDKLKSDGRPKQIWKSGL
jgi:hypothetical protein